MDEFIGKIHGSLELGWVQGCLVPFILPASYKIQLPWRLAPLNSPYMSDETFQHLVVSLVNNFDLGVSGIFTSR